MNFLVVWQHTNFCKPILVDQNASAKYSNGNAEFTTTTRNFGVGPTLTWERSHLAPLMPNHPTHTMWVELFQWSVNFFVGICWILRRSIYRFGGDELESLGHFFLPVGKFVATWIVLSFLGAIYSHLGAPTHLWGRFTHIWEIPLSFQHKMELM